jgi:hypothetical protein
MLQWLGDGRLDCNATAMVGKIAKQHQWKRNGNGDGWLGDGQLSNGRPGDGWHEGLAMNNLMSKQWGWTLWWQQDVNGSATATAMNGLAGWRKGDGNGWLGDGWLGGGRLGDGLRKGLAMDGVTATWWRWIDLTVIDDSIVGSTAMRWQWTAWSATQRCRSDATAMDGLMVTAMNGSATDGLAMDGKWIEDGQLDGNVTAMDFLMATQCWCKRNGNGDGWLGDGRLGNGRLGVPCTAVVFWGIWGRGWL